MVGKIFLLMFTLASLSPVCPSPLTKEITVEHSPQLKFRDILAQLERTDIIGNALTWTFGNFEEIVANVTNLYQSQNTPDISEVLNIFNSGFGTRLLFVNDKYIEVDLKSFEKLLTNNLWSTVTRALPQNYFEQLTVFGVLQKEVQDTVDDLRPKMETRKLPLQKISTPVGSVQNNIDLRASFESIMCDALVTTAYSQLNETLTAAIDVLDSITFSSADNGVFSILVNLASFVVDVFRQGINTVWDLARTVQSSICSTLLSSRKRRDLTFVQESFERSKRDTALSEVVPTLAATRSITVIVTFVWGVLGTVLSYVLASLVNWLIMSITKYLLATVSEWLYSIIDSIF